MDPLIEILASSTRLNANEEVIVCHDPASDGPFDHHCLVRIGPIHASMLLRLEASDRLTVTTNDFTFVPETSVLFFRTNDQWGAIDLDRKKLLNHQSAPWIPIIRRCGDVIIIEDDLTAWSCDLYGHVIDKVQIDPPSEATEFEDHIEYNSPVFGKQTLRFKR